MMLWFILTVMCSAAAVFVAAPFLRSLAVHDEVTDIGVYRDQLKEVDREAAAGLIDASQADAARLEINRRILAANSEAVTAGRRFPLMTYNAAAIAVSGIVVLGSAGLYAVTGRPDVALVSPWHQLSASLDRSDFDRSQNDALSPATALALSTDQQAGESNAEMRRPRAGTVDQMVEGLAQRLQKEPGDAEGWRMLGWSYFNLGRFSEAVSAYRRSIELQPDAASVNASLAEAIVRAEHGNVTPEAVKLFEHALAADPKEASARYYLGLAKEQAGRSSEALDDWIALLEDTDPADKAFAQVRQNIVELSSQTGLDVSGRLSEIPAPDSTTVTGADAVAPRTPAVGNSGPATGGIRGNAEMAPAERDTMIRGMVDKLAARLDASPHDAEGWIKLIRSWTVLGETGKAKAALEQATRAFADQPVDQQRIAGTAKELGVVLP